MLHEKLQEHRATAINRLGVEKLAFAQINDARIAGAQPRRGGHQRIEHGPQVEGRAADHLEHFGRRRLLLERFRQIARLRLNLIEEASIFDGDHRLIREGLHELDLADGEKARLRLAEREHALDPAVTQKRHPERSAKLADLRRRSEIIFRIGEHVGNMGELARHEDAAGEGFAPRLDGVGAQKIDELRRNPRLSLRSHEFPVSHENHTRGSSA